MCSTTHLLCKGKHHSLYLQPVWPKQFFVKVSKSIIFLVKSFWDNFYRHLVIFFWSHCLRLASCMTGLDISSFAYYIKMNNIFSRLVESKPVKQEASVWANVSMPSVTMRFGVCQLRIELSVVVLKQKNYSLHKVLTYSRYSGTCIGTGYEKLWHCLQCLWIYCRWTGLILKEIYKIACSYSCLKIVEIRRSTFLSAKKLPDIAVTSITRRPTLEPIRRLIW